LRPNLTLTTWDYKFDCWPYCI